LRRWNPELHIESVRGNVDTRVRKLDEGQYTSIVLAAAGLKRLGLENRIIEYMEPARMCPAVGQGALAIETLLDGPGFEACGALEHPPTHAAVTAERAVLASLGGGCQVPIGAHAIVTGDRLELIGIVLSPDGAQHVDASSSGLATDAAAIGLALGEQLIASGA